VVIELLGLPAWRVASEEAVGGFVAAIRAGERPVAPDFVLPVVWERDETWPPEARRALAHATVALRELRGYPVVLNFSAPSCIPCKEEAPELVAAARRYRRPVVFLGVDIQDFTRDAKKVHGRCRCVVCLGARRQLEGLLDLRVDWPPRDLLSRSEGRAAFHSIGAVETDDLEVGIGAALRDES